MASHTVASRTGKRSDTHPPARPNSRAHAGRRADAIVSIGPVQITRDRRMYVGRCRIHHGLVGLLLLVHDAKDWQVWIRDLTGR